MEIKKVSWGVANSYPKEDVIEINENLFLPEFDPLREKILEHEREHMQTSSWMGQRKVDLKTELKFKDLSPFYKKFPKTFFQQHSPITYSKEKGTLYFEWSLIFLYLIGIGVAYLVYLLIETFGTSPMLFWKIIKNILIVGGIVLVLYALGKYLKKSTSKIDWNKDKTKLTKQQKKLKRMGLNPEVLG